ncbi:hypothetical protein BJ165DRAFT_437540 [Panaeolus papilionaceus]|nr:hypothetical protein BJ165DRAFT_437540 [Panaeolus papilionaceus]
MSILSITACPSTTITTTIPLHFARLFIMLFIVTTTSLSSPPTPTSSLAFRINRIRLRLSPLPFYSSSISYCVAVVNREEQMWRERT